MKKKDDIKVLVMTLAALLVLVLYAVLAVAFIKMGYNTFGMIFVLTSIVGGMAAIYLIAGGGE